MDKASLAELRKSYERASSMKPPAPTIRCSSSRPGSNEAIHAQLPEPNAMTLATVGRRRPAVDAHRADQGLRCARHCVVHQLRKSQGPRAGVAAVRGAAVSLGRARARGAHRRQRDPGQCAEESDAYYATRPLDSRIGAWASPQSQPIASRAVLVTAAAKFAARYALNPPRPPHWGGYRLAPDRWEFWQGRRSRLHDRICYQQIDGRWARQRLAP